jgi:hypothetical protein
MGVGYRKAMCVVPLTVNSVTLNKGIMNQALGQAIRETQEQVDVFLHHAFYVYFYCCSSVFISADVSLNIVIICASTVSVLCSLLYLTHSVEQSP